MRTTVSRLPAPSNRLRKAMLNAPRLTAVIHQSNQDLIIEFSDGRVRTVPRAHCDPGRILVQAAIQWAKRRGAASVEIHD